MSLPIPNINDLTGTSSATFQIGVQGPIVKNNAGALEFINAAGLADVPITSLNINLSGTSGQITLNSAATESGASWKTIIQNAISGQTSDWTLSLPANHGTTGQLLQTDGVGNTSWVNGAVTVTDIIHTVNFGDSSPFAFLTLPANAIITEIDVIVDTAFNGTSPALSIGVSGTISKFMTAGASDLTTVGLYTTTAVKEVAASGSTQNVIITYGGGSSTVGAARVLLQYSIPTVV